MKSDKGKVLYFPFFYVYFSMSLIINFFGGPGIGKSTQASGLFTEMKKQHMDVELTYEFPKVVAWEENFSAVKDQFYITANQHRNISRLYGKVKYIIVDSPIILGLIYKDRYNDKPEYPATFYGDTYDTFILDLFKKYDSLNIFLNRNDETYDQNGRFQNLDESKEIDTEIKQKLIDNDIPFIEFNVHTNTAMDIFNYIKENKI
jgi:adenylate kinase family enzyme